MSRAKDMRGREKAAILLVALGLLEGELDDQFNGTFKRFLPPLSQCGVADSGLGL